MTFAKEAWPFVLPFVVLAALLFLLRYPGYGTAALVVGLVILLFFRIPVRRYAGDAELVVSPADGVITRVDLIEDPELGPGRFHRIVTFLSVFNIHVQRAAWPQAAPLFLVPSPPRPRSDSNRPQAGST